jgi:hypothetical protein
MAKKRISDEAGLAALRDLGNQQALAVRYLLQVLERGNEGGSIELRVPPFGAAQLIGGQTHRRGTPPNVVEADPESFIALALGHMSWDELAASGKLIASGAKAHELRNLFPIHEVR